MSLSGFIEENIPEIVKDLAAKGISRQNICIFTGVQSEPELEQYFAKEMRRAVIETESRVAGTLLEMATNGKNASAAMFWLRARHGWAIASAERDNLILAPVTVDFEPYPKLDQPGPGENG